MAAPRQGGVRTARRTCRGTDTSRAREGEAPALLEPLLESRDPGWEATRSPTAPRSNDGVESRRARARGRSRAPRLSRRRGPAPRPQSAPPHTRPGLPWPPVPARAVPTRAEPRGRTPTAGALPHGRETLWGPSPGLSSRTVPRCGPIWRRYPTRMSSSKNALMAASGGVTEELNGLLKGRPWLLEDTAVDTVGHLEHHCHGDTGRPLAPPGRHRLSPKNGRGHGHGARRSRRKVRLMRSPFVPAWRGTP
jgi:hypothetical protein